MCIRDRYYNSGRIDSTASIDQKTISEIVADQRDAKITVTLYTDVYKRQIYH